MSAEGGEFRECRCCKKPRRASKLVACVWCPPGERVFCPKCDQCPTCKNYEPAFRRCGGSKHEIPRDEEGVRCVDCDEFLYCSRCVRRCECGRGPTDRPHYVCGKRGSDTHTCCYYHDSGDEASGGAAAEDPPYCERPACHTHGGVPRFSRGGNNEREGVCAQHLVHVRKRVRAWEQQF